MTTLGKGLKPSTPSKVAYRLSIAVRTSTGAKAEWAGHPLVAGVLSAPIPNFADLSLFTPRGRVINGRAGPPDQDASSACAWHSFSAGLYTACAAQGQSLPWLPSPDLGYKAMRAIERA